MNKILISEEPVGKTKAHLVRTFTFAPERSSSETSFLPTKPVAPTVTEYKTFELKRSS